MNDDTISRKTVIDAVHTATYGFICGMDDGDEMTDADKLVLSINKAVCAAIKALPTPSAQPESTIGQLSTDNQSTKTDVISRRAAIDEFDGVKVNEENCTEYDIGYNDGIDFAVSKLSVLPSVQPSKREWYMKGYRDAQQKMRGKWKQADKNEPYIVQCSVCRYLTDNESNYCPNCGADMRGTE